MKKILIAILSIVALVSCQSDDAYENLNRDPKNPTQVDAEFLFNSAVKSLFDQMTDTNVNLNIFRLLGQHWTETTYTDEANYDFNTRNIPDNHWSQMNRNVLLDLTTAKEVVSSNPALTQGEKDSRNAQIEVLMIYTWAQLVETYGDIPYSQALNAGEYVLPVYDDAATIYKDLLSRLTAVIPSISGTGFGSVDAIYGGSPTAWKKFANSLLLRMGLRVIDAPGMASVAQSAITTAISGGVFTSNDDNAALEYESDTPNTNPIWLALVQSNRTDYIPANTLVDFMNNLNDPRRKVYFDANLKPSIGTVSSSSTASGVATVTFSSTLPTGLKIGDEVYAADDTFVGKISSISGFSIVYTGTAPANGVTLKYLLYDGGPYGDNNSFGSYTHINGYNNGAGGVGLHDPTLKACLIDYAEVCFYLADAAERSISGTPAAAAGFYNSGITASFDYWGATDVATYLANPSVAYATAPGTAKQKIGNQLWLAMYNRGFEAWTAWRIYDTPTFNLPAISGSPVPTRYTYPVNEQNLNEVNWTAASSAIGGDAQTTKLFFDVN
jgi:hypothetical protein